MMAGRYEKTLWQHYTSEGFPDAPIKYNLVRNLHSHRQELNRIRDLRNHRVFHYEPVFPDLLADYNNAKKLISWLSQDALRLLEEFDRKTADDGSVKSTHEKRQLIEEQDEVKVSRPVL
jgi:hypothetical protein